MSLPSEVVTRDQRSPNAVGRHAKLQLTFSLRNGRTILRDAYAEPPYRVGGCFPEGRGLHVIVASSAPGVFGGDCLQQTIRVERGAEVRLTSQSALQVHATADARTAVLHSEYHIDDDARLHCVWHPSIPFADARLQQRIGIHIADSGQLHWSDALMCGRQARGERWMFASLAHELSVSRAGALEYLERYTAAQPGMDVARAWIVGSASYLGTTLSSGRDIAPDSAERLHAELATIGGLSAAVDALDRRLLLVRLMSRSGPCFHDARTRVDAALATSRSLADARDDK